MPTHIVFPDREDLPEGPPFTAAYVASVEWCWDGCSLDRRDEYWISRTEAGEWLMWISGEDRDGDACHILYATSDDPQPAAAAAAAMLSSAWRAEGHGRFAFITGTGLLDRTALARIAEGVWGAAEG